MDGGSAVSITTPAEYNRVNRITLPAVPGITLDTTHAETAPRQPMIRRPMGPVKGVALQAQARHRIEMVRAAILAVMEGEE